MHLGNSTSQLAHAVDIKRLLSSPKKELLPVLRALSDWETVGRQLVAFLRVSVVYRGKVCAVKEL